MSNIYQAGSTAIHRLNPASKLVLAISLGISALAAHNVWMQVGVLLLCLVLLAWARALTRSIKAIYPFFLFFIPILFVVQSLFWSGESQILRLGPVEVQVEGIRFSIEVTVRLITLLLGFYLLQATTRPGELVSDLERRGLPPRMAFVLLATLQAIDEMKEYAAAIMQAQQCRGVEVQGNLMLRLRAFFPIVSPLIIGSLLNVENRALALELRGFNAGVPKTFINTSDEQTWERFLRWGFIFLAVIILGIRLAWLRL